MARPQTRFVVAGMVLALLLALMPMSSRAQTSSEVFAEALASQAASGPLAGPNALELEQATGVLTVYKAGLDVTDFVAHAEFVNPEVVEGVGWDYGFQFRTTGNNEDFRVFVTSDGMWNFSIGTATPSQSAVAPGFDNIDHAGGEVNALDLVVRRLAGDLRGERPVGCDRPAVRGADEKRCLRLDRPGQPFVSEGRIVALSNFSVFPLPGAEWATPEPAAPGSEQGTALPTLPVQRITGTCRRARAAAARPRRR